MLAFIRAGLVAALMTLVFSVSAYSADKPFQRADLADSAVRLETQIKTESGQVAKPVATLRSEAEAAFAKRDFRAGMQILAQIVSVAPREAGNWLRLSRTILQIRTADDRERANFLERAATAAYIAYQRSGNSGEEADALVLLGRTFAERKLWRPALDSYRFALDLKEVADVRQAYEALRDQHGFRILDYSVDADAASPRACFQFSEDLPGKRTDFSPFIAVDGQDKPAITTEEKQLCVEGLKHGERYSMTLRAGLPSTVKETLQKSADYNIYVRDRSPYVRFTGKAYVLPRTGQRGIPVVSVNTSTVKVKVYRVGDRNLIDTVLGSDFQRNIDRGDRRKLESQTGALAWDGELKIDPVLNADVTTAFPVDQAIGDLKPGVYVMTAEPETPPRDEEYGQLATQWFIVSDLGLTAFSGNDGINVFLNSLATTDAKAGIEIRLMARNNEVLATRTTDAAGFARFEAGFARGDGGLSPAMLIADGKGDYAFLSLKGPAFDLTDRGVAGRAVTAGLDAFVYAERGVYRTGETVYLTTLLRDANGIAVTGVPMTLVIERPDGVEYRRTVVQDGGIGGRSLSVPMISAAPTGTYRIRAYTDPKGPSIGSASFLVEDYVPDRMEFDLASPTGKISQTAPAEVTVDGRFLYGAPASNLDLEGEVKIKAADSRPGFAGYQFGVNDEDEEVKTEQQALEDLPQTDDNGKAKFTVTLDKLPSTSRPLQADITVRLVESGGRAVERNLTIPIVPTATMIGVKPLFSGKSLGDGENAGFDVVVASPDGKQIASKGLRYELLKIERRYQYYRRDGRWDYEPIKSTRRTADGRVEVAADRPGRISLPVSWGRYRLDVASDDPSVPPTSVTFDSGFYSDASADTPDLLEIALDKTEYASGETMTVAVTARTAGKVTLSVIGDKLMSTTTADVQAGNAKIPLKVGSDWGSGAYVVATLRRPLDEAASRMPGRAIGVQWFAVDRKARTLAFEMPLPSLMRPNETLRVPVRLSGLAAGEEARIVVAAVDVGILNLTGYKPPAPDDYYLGQRRLTAEVRDLYGQLLDGMQGTRGTIRTGGDGAGRTGASPPTQPPLALYSGIVVVKSDGTAEVQFDIPAFAGTVRVMAIAWSKDKVGKASGDVTVRDPVVLTATLPRFLLTGDQGTMRLDLDNVEGPAGEYKITLKTDGPLRVGQGTQTVRLNGKQRSGLSLPINAAAVGIGNVAVQVSGPNGYELQRSYTLAAKASTQVLTRRTVRPIAKGENLSLSNDLFADLVPGTGAVQVSVGPSTALDVAALLKALDRYPYGCSEQTTSRALPLLYVNELANESHLSLDLAIDQRIRDAIDRLLARQGSNGSFGLWSPGGEDVWLDAYVTDFLTRARERNFAVPDVAFRLALDRLRNHLGQSDPAKEVNSEIAYVYYVLARNGVAPLGDLRYLADTKLDGLKTPIAKAQLAAALGMLGDKTRAERVYAAALDDIAPQPKLELGRTDYGSSLRDASAFVALASEGSAPRATILKAVERIEAARALSPYTSTQENAWMVLAARALARDTAGMALDVGGEQRRGPLYRSFKPSDLSGGPVRVTNNGENSVQAVVSVVGAPVTPEPAADKGFGIERIYYTLDGERAEIAKVKQNERFAVVLKITEGQPQFGRIIIADYLPAGFEIDNPRLVSSGDTGTLSWIQDAKEPTHSEFRDDRFTAAFDRASGDKAVFTVAYVVRAVSPGKYVLPQAYVEDMYRPDRFGRTGVGSVEIEAAK